MTMKIAMWSGPRNLSTAMMRSFGARADTFVTDEPFYGAYLKATGDPQPMADAVMASMDCSWDGVAAAMTGACPSGAAIWYQKHMAHHMEGPVGHHDLAGLTHAFLIRDPARVVASYAAKRVAVRPDHLGTARQRAFFEAECDRIGHAPPVIESADVLADPAAMLTRLCTALGIAWDDTMLRWEPGLRDTDGVWASHWYDAVAGSTGFGALDTKPVMLDDAGQAVAEACRADYEALARWKLRVE